MSVKRSGTADARVAVVASWFVILVLAFQGIASMLSQVTDELSPAQRALGILSSVVCSVVFVLVQRATMRQRDVPVWWCWLLVAAACLGFFVGTWLNAALAIGMFGLTLSGRRLGAAVGASLVAMAVFLLAQQLPPVFWMWYLLVVYAVALLLHVLTRLAVTVAELLLARETVSRMRVDEERHRISRDLHDILGRSLVAVSLRVQTVIRLLDREPERTRDQLEEIARMIADGQSRLRALTRGEQVTGLAEEVEATLALLALLRIRCDVDLSQGQPLRPVVDGLGARVVRECVTNLLKHSRPTTVEISLREESRASVLVVLNDGARYSCSSTGTGLVDLAARVQDIGGTMEAGHLVRGRFRVIVRLPHAELPDRTTGGDETPRAAPTSRTTPGASQPETSPTRPELSPKVS